MRIVVVLFSILICMLAKNVWADDDYNPLTITSPANGDSFFYNKTIHIGWQNDLGDGFTSSISFSSDGKVFSIPIASGLNTCEYMWKTDAFPGTSGYIKVKMMDYNGVQLYEQVVNINWTPENAIIVSKANQKVYRFEDGKLKYIFTCSTALPEFDGTEGEYKIFSRQIKHWSKKYELWMPYALFYHEGYALHATTQIRKLGRQASHGCVRLHPRDARILFNDVPVGTNVIILPKSVRVSYTFSDGEQSPLVQTCIK